MLKGGIHYWLRVQIFEYMKDSEGKEWAPYRNQEYSEYLVMLRQLAYFLPREEIGRYVTEVEIDTDDVLLGDLSRGEKRFSLSDLGVRYIIKNGNLALWLWSRLRT